MTPRQFVECFANEKDSLIDLYMGKSEPGVARVGDLKLTPAQRRKCRAMLDSLLTDAFYTVLLAIDGEAQLGGKQVSYSLKDEEGNELTGGEIEGEAYERFHGSGARKSKRRKRRRSG